MSRFKLDRRTVIKGAGTIAIALPWLEAMGFGRRANAQTTSVPLKRFLTVYQPGGAVRSGAIGDKYTPTGTETAFTLSQTLAPLDPVRSKLLIVDGLNLTCVMPRAPPSFKSLETSRCATAFTLRKLRNRQELQARLSSFPPCISNTC
jgi:hypothetical protein